jgi:hypothetical protein
LHQKHSATVTKPCDAQQQFAWLCIVACTGGFSTRLSSCPRLYWTPQSCYSISTWA